MKRTKGLILVSLLAMAVVVGSSSIILSAVAQGETSPGPQRGLSPWMSQLTDDQKAQIQQLVQSMKDSGATPQEIRDAVNAKLQEWGIQLPERSGGQHQLSPWMSQLTDDQKAQIQQLVESLRESGASPKEIRDAVKATLEGWGIEAPERVGRGQRLSPWMSQLTDEQKEEIQQLIQSMRDDGATPQEIRDAVKTQLLAWGIELPAPPQSSGQ